MTFFSRYFFLNEIFIKAWLFYNVVLVSSVQQSDSTIHIFFFIFFSIVSYCKVLNTVP